MTEELPLIKEIIILDPPTYYSVKKVKKSKAAGEDVFDKHYLTANLFYIQNVSYHVVSKIIYDCKKYLKEHIGDLPELERIYLEFEYHSKKDIDLDNKSFYWRKLFMDVLKTPTPRQIENAKKKNKEIITTNTIKDDDTKYYRKGSEEYFYGEHKMIFRIFGRVKSTQETLDLFFVNP